MAVQDKRFTREDLIRLSDAGQRYELIHGELREMAPVKHVHGILVSQLIILLGKQLSAHGKISTEVGFDLSEDTTVAPDVAYVANGRFDKENLNDYVPGAPDLAIEVISPSESANDVHETVNLYLKYGTKMVLAVYSKTRTIVVHTQANSVTLNVGDVLDGASILPGFKLSIEDVFSVLDD